MTRLFLRVQGIVQGVGFRPFVTRLARSLALTGHVENTTRGVEIEIQGSPEAVEAFRRALVDSPPPMASILGMEAHSLAPVPEEQGFDIRASRVDPVASAVIPPDIATCRACLSELLDPRDRRHGYPFLNCTDCGPRYTVIASLPYDRSRTSMAGFTQCAACAEEYADSLSRRFHAQPNACPVCGPRLSWKGPSGEDLPGDPIAEAVRLLAAGGIVALLGVGGFHLACDAANDGAVAELRRRKTRPAKPLAVMVADISAARALAQMEAEAEALLQSPRAPIVLAPSRPDSPLAVSVCPGQDRVGVFLPYTPLHHLLFRHGTPSALVMTSGNRSDEPMLATWDEARVKLIGVADQFLVHDRPILHRVDDSVVKTMGAAGSVVIRRARGYAPGPVPLRNPHRRVALAVGAELANTYAVGRGQFAYLGPHVGDIKNLDVEETFRSGIDHFLDLLRVQPDLIACDLHPQYRSSAYAREWEARGTQVVRVQHHEAHASACMEESRFEGEALVLALDGLGYGHDGTIWGGELLAGRPGYFERMGHLIPVPQPGGDRAAREPWRMAASHLRRLVGKGWKELPLAAFLDRPAEDLEALDTMMAGGIQSPLTSSCGRLFDAAAAMLGFRGPLLYSAQSAMELEALAARCPVSPPSCPDGAVSEAGGRIALDPAPILEALLSDALAGKDQRECALSFHAGVAGLFAKGAARASERTGLRDVFLTGGCVQNAVLVEHLCRDLVARGLQPHTHREVPPNDGGISFGQLAWALARASEPSR